MTIAVPCYRLCGDLWFQHEEPSEAHIAYNRQLWDFNSRTGWSGYPQHARAACRNYAETLRDLASAGF